MSKFYSNMLVDAAGFPWTFVALAGLNLLALPLIPIVFKRKAVGRLGVIDAH